MVMPPPYKIKMMQTSGEENVCILGKKVKYASVYKIHLVHGHTIINLQYVNKNNKSVDWFSD